jgi:hypothetical protein
MIGWGILATATAAAKNFAQLAAIRIMLGVFEVRIINEQELPLLGGFQGKDDWMFMLPRHCGV